MSLARSSSSVSFPLGVFAYVPLYFHCRLTSVDAGDIRLLGFGDYSEGRRLSTRSTIHGQFRTSCLEFPYVTLAPSWVGLIVCSRCVGRLYFTLRDAAGDFLTGCLAEYRHCYLHRYHRSISLCLRPKVCSRAELTIRLTGCRQGWDHASLDARTSLARPA
jgi:hypothetical protein